MSPYGVLIEEVKIIYGTLKNKSSGSDAKAFVALQKNREVRKEGRN